MRRLIPVSSLAAFSLTLAACSGGNINPSAGPHSAPASGSIPHHMAYVSATDSTGAGVLVPIDLTTNKPGTPMLTPPGTSTTAIAISPDGKTAYATMVKTGTNTGTVVPIDLATNRLSAGISTVVNAPPLAIAIAPDGKTAYVTGAVAAADGSTVVTANGAAVLMAINLTTNTLRPVSGVTNGTFPLALAISPDGKTAYMTDIAKVFTIGETGGGVEPFDLATGTLGAGLPTPINTYPRSIAIAPDGKTAYVIADGTGSGGVVVPIDLTTQYLTAETPIEFPDGTTPYAIAITPDGTTAYVVVDGAAGVSGSVMPIKLAIHTSGTPIPIEGNPAGIAITPDGKTAYVTSRKSSSGGAGIAGAIDAVWPINVTTNSAMAPILVGSNPAIIAIAP